MQIGVIRREYCNRCQEPTVQRLDGYTKKPPTNIWRCISGDHYVGFRELEILKASYETRARRLGAVASCPQAAAAAGIDIF